MKPTSWKDTPPAQKREVIGFLLLGIGYLGTGILMSFSLPLLAVLTLIAKIAGLVLTIWGVAGNQQYAKKYKTIQILLAVGIFCGALIGTVCIVIAAVMQLRAGKQAKKHDESELNKW